MNRSGRIALYRTPKAAIDKLASPEQLDVLMRVTSPMGWLGLHPRPPRSRAAV